MESPGPSRRALLRGHLLSRRIAVIDSLCLAEAGIICRSCGEACGHAAIRFSPRIGLPPRPIVDQDVCTGCGECVAACPGEAIALGAPRHAGAS